MQYKEMNLCDFCFTPIAPGSVCPNCGLTHETYRAAGDLLPPGTNLMGKYIIGRVLGRGGFGATYLAYSSEQDRVTAIKEYFPNGIACRGKDGEKVYIVSEDKKEIFQKGETRFFEEAQTVSRFNTNQNIVSVYEFFYTNGTAYYSMEYLHGIDLKGYIARKHHVLSEAEAVTIMRGVCEALVAIHSTGTLHRDISPDNIFICTDSIVKLIDFGAAKQVVGEHAQQNYSVVVKEGFAPPEQYQSNGRQGMWTDIYAVGATIYYTLTGNVPMNALNRKEDPDVIFNTNMEINPQFKAILRKCLQPEIKDRYQSAIELIGDLNTLSIQNVTVGGTDYVQSIYNGFTSEQRDGQAVILNAQPQPQPIYQSGYNPHMPPQYTNSQMPPVSQYPPNAPYPNSQYPNPQMPPTQPYPNSQYSNVPYPNSQIPPASQYPNSQIPPYVDTDAHERSGMTKGLIIGILVVVVLLILILLIVFIVRMTSLSGPPGGMPPGGMPPQSGQMPPMGGPMQ